MQLFPNHLEDLRNSGLTDATIEAAELYSEANHDKLALLLNRKSWNRKQGAALVVPYHDSEGAVILRRVKPDTPAIGRNGRKAKYLSPVGSRPQLYVPPSINGELKDTKTLLAICEGEKKALAGVQAGLVTVGLQGVDCWHEKRSSKLIPDLERIPWRGRKVVIIFDSDAATNTNVRDNETLLAAHLGNHGAEVKIVRLPPGPDGEKIGLDDFLVANDDAKLWELIDQAAEPERPDPAAMKIPGKELDAAAEAGRILSSVEVDGTPKLRFWRGEFWHWQRGAYRAQSKDEIRARVITHLNTDTFKLTGRVVNDILDQLKAQSIIPTAQDAPQWLAEPKPWPADEVLVARNGLFHLPSIVDKKENWSIGPTPRMFATSALDFDVSLDVPPPFEWLSFLRQVWPDDPESIATLQEWFGYILTADTSRQKALFIIGPRRSGKGVITRILRELIGPENVCGPTLGALGGTFGLWSLLGKSLAIVADARLSGRSDKGLIVERLLSVTGEDALDIDRKFLEPLRSVRLPTRFLLSSNEVPRLQDASTALASRFLFLAMTQSWLGREDVELTARLLGELPSVLIWAVAGWRRLRERGHFVQPAAGEALAREMEDLASGVHAFVRDCCEVDASAMIPRDALFDAFRDWCKSEAKDFVSDKTSFGRNLRAVVPGVGDRRPRGEGGRTRNYTGVTLRSGW